MIVLREEGAIIVMKKENEGFSLIEVVIAITVLAILTMPILAYFTNAAVSTSNGKGTQKANMAAQSVLEELNSCTNFDQIENKLVAVTGSAWTVDSIEATKSSLTKKVMVDGTLYQTKVTLDYEYSRTDINGDETTSQYNEYNAPKLKEVYSPTNVVMAESDQTETAAGNLHYTNQDVSVSAIEAAMTRTLSLDVRKGADSEGNTLYFVKGYYTYRYNGDTYTAVLKDTKIEKLENVYIFYNLLRDNVVNEPVEINFTNVGESDAKKLNLYFVCQKTSVTKPAGYAINVTGTGTYLSANRHVELADLVEKTPEKRIAKITVDVYHAGETSFTDSTRLVRLQTSKGA